MLNQTRCCAMQHPAVNAPWSPRLEPVVVGQSRTEALERRASTARSFDGQSRLETADPPGMPAHSKVYERVPSLQEYDDPALGLRAALHAPTPPMVVVAQCLPPLCAKDERRQRYFVTLILCLVTKQASRALLSSKGHATGTMRRTYAGRLAIRETSLRGRHCDQPCSGKCCRPIERYRTVFR